MSDENLCIKECVHICVFVNALSWLSVVDLEKGKRMSLVHINEIYIYKYTAKPLILTSEWSNDFLNCSFNE